jgi:glutamate N-acetyltransferase/amino-acid N-acetyltransferase
MAAVRRGIAAAGRALSPDGWADFTQAILTTDKGPKVHVVRTGGVTIAGCAKGAGMIAPNLATTLAFVVTDARVPGLRRLVRAAAEATFNRVLVDGDTSTNDSLFCLASGRTPAPRGFAGALADVFAALALQIVRDGEGATRVVRIEVAGAASPGAAEKVARRIATSPLVKTAIAGADPNWGRIVCAVGNAGVPITPARVAVWLDRVPVVRRGVGVPGAEARAHAVMSQPTYTIRVDLGSGAGAAHATTCDLTHEYVTINASYRS